MDLLPVHKNAADQALLLALLVKLWSCPLMTYSYDHWYLKVIQEEACYLFPTKAVRRKHSAPKVCNKTWRVLT